MSSRQAGSEQSPFLSLHHPHLPQALESRDTLDQPDIDYPRPSASSNTPLQPSSSSTSFMYPPQRPPLEHTSTSFSTSPSAENSRNVHTYDPERSAPRHHERPPHNKHNGSWDLLSGVKQSYQEFDSRNASEAHLVYADGDVPKNRFIRLYNYLLNVSIITRWIIFIVPILGLLWIPGILSLTAYPHATVWGVRLLWWSVWLSVCWGGWWAALAAARILPIIIRSTLGVVAVGTRRYIDWLQALHRYIAFFAWGCAVWIAWNPIIDDNQQSDAGDKSKKIIDLILKLLSVIVFGSLALLFEKFSIQWIATKFHERSYSDRIAEQKFAVHTMVTLYRNSSDIPGRSDTMYGAGDIKDPALTRKRLFSKFRQGIRTAATTTTTALGNVASEIAGSSILQPNSPQAMVKTALESANKSRLLARRLFYSFAKDGSDVLLVQDIERYFPNPEEALRAFTLFDKDGNGDVTRDEVEMACLEFHREQLSLENSMRDVDSAVGRLDNILMGIVVIIFMLLFAIAFETQLVTVVTGAGTFVLGLSWLIGGSLQEVLTSIIFLFIKHPFDVGDRVVINKDIYTVKEMNLLSTVFIDSNSICVQAPNNALNTLFIQNFRRSPQMSETFSFDVSYATTFEDLENLREKMLEFVKTERRDYQPSFDVVVKDFPDQERMTLTADIKYKSNAQQGALKTKRRNKWICALKMALSELKIYGPKGNPDAPPGVSRYTKVPWELIDAKDHEAAASKDDPSGDNRAPGELKLADNNAVILDSADDIFGDTDELHMSNPRRRVPQPQSSGIRPPAPTGASQNREVIEMTKI